MLLPFEESSAQSAGAEEDTDRISAEEKNPTMRYDTKEFDTEAPVMLKYTFIAITPRSTLDRSHSTEKCSIDWSNITVWYLNCGGTRGVMVIVVGNGHGDRSSNPGRSWLHFTLH